MPPWLARLLDNTAGNVLAAAVIAAFWALWAIAQRTPAPITGVFAVELFLFLFVTALAVRDWRRRRAQEASSPPAKTPTSEGPVLADNELRHQGMIWRLNAASLESGTDPLEGPFCPTHREVVFYRNFAGALISTLNDGLLLGEHGWYYCPIDRREEFRVHGGLILKHGQVRQEVLTRFKNRGRGLPAVSPALDVYIRAKGGALVVTRAPTIVMFLTFSKIEVVNAMPRNCIVSLGLRLRLTYSGWQVLPAGSLFCADELPEDVELSPALPHLISLSMAGTARSSVVGHATFALEALDQSRVGVHQSLDLLTPDNMRFEIFEPAAEQTRICTVDSAPLPWRRISL